MLSITFCSLTLLGKTGCFLKLSLEYPIKKNFLMHFHQTKTKSQTKFPPPHHPSKQINTKTSPPPTPQQKKIKQRFFQKYPSLKGPELERVGCLVPCLGSKLIGKIDAEGERWWNHVSIFKCICVFMICLFVFNYMCFGIYIYLLLLLLWWFLYLFPCCLPCVSKSLCL